MAVGAGDGERSASHLRFELASVRRGGAVETGKVAAGSVCPSGMQTGATGVQTGSARRLLCRLRWLYGSDVVGIDRVLHNVARRYARWLLLLRGQLSDVEAFHGGGGQAVAFFRGLGAVVETFVHKLIVVYVGVEVGKGAAERAREAGVVHLQKRSNALVVVPVCCEEPGSKRTA